MNFRLIYSNASVPFSEENKLSSSEEDYSSSTSRLRKHRRRVVIKKKRRKLPVQSARPSHTNRRRKVVVTRKRLLTATTTGMANTDSATVVASIYNDLPNYTSTIAANEILISKSTFGIEEFANATSYISETIPPATKTTKLPEYTPFFPELSESLDAPLVLLKTTLISSVEYEIKTVVQSRPRTYTFVVTRVNGKEQTVTSTTEVKLQTTTLTVTEPRTRYTTLTLLDLEPTKTLPFAPLTIDSSYYGAIPPYLINVQEEDGRVFDEARHNNLATRVMSNGVEVIVAGDKSTLPGEPDVKRILPSSIYKPVTLRPSTLSDHMMLMLPQEASKIESLSSSLHPNQFVTKTCLTTFTYLTTYLENGITTISSHEQVVSNIATEERNSINIASTPSAGITLTQHPNLAVATFMTTYTYLNTMLDGEQPLVVTSKYTVTNTVTAPDDYLSLLQPPKQASAEKDTNTYYSTISLKKTLYENQQQKIVSTNEILTQVVITESVPPKATSVMTSYIALDVENNDYNQMVEYTTTNVLKTYYVTYTYFNTFLENGQTVIKTNVSTSSDVVTEKLFLHPKRTHTNSVINTLPIVQEKLDLEPMPHNFEIYATKTYITTFTYYTTLLQENEENLVSTVISSRTKEEENIITETIDPSLLDKPYILLLQSELNKGRNSVRTLATLQNGQRLEVTAVKKEQITPTKVTSIEKTKLVETITSVPVIESSNPNVVTGSTIIYFDEVDQVSSKKPTPSLTDKPLKATAAKNQLSSLLNSEVVSKPSAISIQKHVSKTQTKRHTNKNTRIPIVSSKSNLLPTTATALPLVSKNKTSAALIHPVQKRNATKAAGSPTQIPDLLGLGSININSLHALKPVINVMAGLIKTNFKSNKKNDTLVTTPTPKIDVIDVPETKKDSAFFTSDVQNRSPVYIPLGVEEEGLEIAESQNIAVIHINEWDETNKKPHKDQIIIGKPTHESPLLNGGIPISPGQVITANSDVIVGKPGRIGPRIPSLSMSKDNHNETPIDMKPPPISPKIWPKYHNEKFIDNIPAASSKKEKLEKGGNQNSYYDGPPPPLVPPKISLRPLNFVRGEKHKSIERKRVPSSPHHNHEPNRIPISFQNFEYSSVPQDTSFPPIEEPLLKPNSFNLQPSIINEPIVLPEVIERSTGQPLLVNLQPSQIAFVNIPHNRTTALIYGGSTEPHRNGQYFDDPSPYPEPEFSGIENFNNGVPQYASVYDDTQPPNQKQVEGVIKVGSNIINNNPPNAFPTNSLQIRPSRPTNEIPPKNFYHNVNGNVPPISFGMMHFGNDFNAHVINHGDIFVSGEATTHRNTPNIKQASSQEQYDNEIHGLGANVENLVPSKIKDIASVQNSLTFLYQSNKQQKLGQNSNINAEVAQYLVPPQINAFGNSKQKVPIKINFETNPFPHSRPHIPINIDEPADIIVPPPPYSQVNIPLDLKPEIHATSSPPYPNNIHYDNPKPNPIPIPLTPQLTRNEVSTHFPLPEDEIETHKEDYTVNEAGEVLQESNTRPLRPGQLPTEILRANLTKGQSRPIMFSNNTNQYPKMHNFDNKMGVIYNYDRIPKPSIQRPRPFQLSPIVRPENQQNNQINHYEQTSFVINENKYQNPLKQPNNQHTFNSNNILINSHKLITTKQPHFHHTGKGDVNISFGQYMPNLYNSHQYSYQRVKQSKPQVTAKPFSPPTESKYNNSIASKVKDDLHDHASENVKFVQSNLYATSMPVDPSYNVRQPPVNIYEYAHNYGTQTEKPFNISFSKVHSPTSPKNNISFTFNNDDVMIIQNKYSNPNYVTSKSTITSDLENVTRYNSDMGIMKPPPIPSANKDIVLVPNLNYKKPFYDPQSQSSTPPPYSKKTHLVEEVMGLSPPPPITTHRPPLHFKYNVTTTKPIISFVKDDSNKFSYPNTFAIPSTTATTSKKQKPFTRYPFTRKPSAITKRPTQKWKQPAASTESKVNITTDLPNYNKHQPAMEIIIGNPNLNITVNLTKSVEDQYESSEKNKLETVHFEDLLQIDNMPTSSTKVVPNIEHNSTATSLNPTSINTMSSSVLPHNFTTGLHHAGNEIKIVDDFITSTTVPTFTTKLSKPSSSSTNIIYKENKTIVPTRYITHTKTSTVTITKTTVVKTPGGAPSTMTILVTKTEKSTVVDTVTEIHTLVQPTSITETITTTINQIPTTLYAPDMSYGSTYLSYPSVPPTPVLEPSVTTTSTPTIIEEDDLEEFIIRDTEPPPSSESSVNVHVAGENDSIFVVMTDQNHGEVIKIPEKNKEAYETQSRDEVPSVNEVNHVLLGGILIASPPSLDTPQLKTPPAPDKCTPECKASKNELCQKVEGIMRCVCRPGFARMFPDRPCKPTYTYSIKLGLERHGKEKLMFEQTLADDTSSDFTQLATTTHEALDRMVMQSDLRDIYHGVRVYSYEPVANGEGILNNFYLQLSDNINEQRLQEIFKKYLRNNNYSLGGTDLFASKEALDNLSAEDFDECVNTQFHDCSEHAHCFNLPGTYTCSCKEGYSDLSENALYPGRICSAELIGCEKCHYHGTCYSRGDNQVICECFQWYAGESCQVNLKVLLIALVTLGTLLFILLLVCIILTCARKKPRNPPFASGVTFMPQRLSVHNTRRSTLDRRAMIQDTSSESSQSETSTLPYNSKKKKQAKKGFNKGVVKNGEIEGSNSMLTFGDQKDRSLPVMIPRAKYHPAPPTSPLLNMEPFDKRKASASSNETKLLSYLDAGPSPNKVDPKRKYSKTPSNSFPHEKLAATKMTGGALVSAGFEVSATVGGAMGTMGTIDTTCGTEADRSENATLIQKISADLLSSTGTQSQFTTFRKSLTNIEVEDPLSNWLDIPPKLTNTVSEARSYDETTIQPPTKSYRNGYDSKPSSHHQNDEANTMAERDVGSTFLLPHTHLYKPDRGSDISGFDSL